MKIRERSAISQSLDLFIIIGAVLAVGGIVVSTATGLIGAATTTPPLQLVQYQLVGSSSAGNPDSLTLTLKNVGTSTLAIGSSFSVTLNTNSVTTSASTTCTASGDTPVSYAGSNLVTFQAMTTLGVASCTATGTLTGLRWQGPSTSVSLSPGQQLTFSVSPTIAQSTPITTGTTYQVIILSNTQSIIQNVVSQ